MNHTLLRQLPAVNPVSPQIQSVPPINRLPHLWNVLNRWGKFCFFAF
jgi:hypothetical protein